MPGRVGMSGLGIDRAFFHYLEGYISVLVQYIYCLKAPTQTTHVSLTVFLFSIYICTCTHFSDFFHCEVNFFEFLSKTKKSSLCFFQQEFGKEGKSRIELKNLSSSLRFDN